MKGNVGLGGTREAGRDVNGSVLCRRGLFSWLFTLTKRAAGRTEGHRFAGWGAEKIHERPPMGRAVEVALNGSGEGEGVVVKCCVVAGTKGAVALRALGRTRYSACHSSWGPCFVIHELAVEAARTVCHHTNKPLE